ncbi:hypothetical protein OESDEN_20210 [Oesophagostomum dentatum]|uniref:Sugar phosphate phosphatase n=1 Tax=Oesophagostomum dentatum TaxID=61180 RepID=A0A0B1S467_OESDE|nr:hypothetical protein OESDEN_20210 [Oesophagostomum dentatum]
MLSVAKKLEEKQRRETLEDLLKLCLWGNKCDIALTDGDVPMLKHSPTEAARMLDPFILRNDLKTAIDSFFLRLRPNKKGLRELHVVLDNMGPEFMNDLIFVEYVMETKLADRTILHGKEYPYFISDATRNDFEWALAELNRLDGGVLLFHDHRFWTHPYPYSEMKTVAPDLYSELSEASIIIFKGDMNYQKLDANIDWSFETPFQVRCRTFFFEGIALLQTHSFFRYRVTNSVFWHVV